MTDEAVEDLVGKVAPKAKAPKAAGAPKEPAAPVVVGPHIDLVYTGAQHYWKELGTLAAPDLAGRVSDVTDVETSTKNKTVTIFGPPAATAEAKKLVEGLWNIYNDELKLYKASDPAYLACGTRANPEAKAERSRLERVFLLELAAMYPKPYPHPPAPVKEKPAKAPKAEKAPAAPKATKAPAAPKAPKANASDVI